MVGKVAKYFEKKNAGSHEDQQFHADKVHADKVFPFIKDPTSHHHFFNDKEGNVQSVQTQSDEQEIMDSDDGDGEHENKDDEDCIYDDNDSDEYDDDKVLDMKSKTVVKTLEEENNKATVKSS